mmetsp:Transcript_8332/g.25046  ORF Transcript_8332/g.25046 Transcript_8332/m.25046 type:complete len:665 (+) Transcript_8332:210-2204(+)
MLPKTWMWVLLAAALLGVARADDGAVSSSVHIIGGVEVDSTRFGYIGLYGEKGSFSGSICSCTLVSPDQVIIAAHCITGRPAEVKFGEVDFISGGKGRSYDVRSVATHPRWSKKESFMGYDIAVLTLTEEVTIQRIRPVKIDFSGRDVSSATAIGFGVDASLYNDLILRKVRLPVVSNSECRALQALRLDREERYLCAGGKPSGGAKKRGVCAGDSGGPLIISGGEPEADVIVGLASFVVGHCNSEYESVFTNLAEEGVQLFLKEHARISADTDSESRARSKSEPKPTQSAKPTPAAPVTDPAPTTSPKMAPKRAPAPPPASPPASPSASPPALIEEEDPVILRRVFISSVPGTIPMGQSFLITVDYKSDTTGLLEANVKRGGEVLSQVTKSVSASRGAKIDMKLFGTGALNYGDNCVVETKLITDDGSTVLASDAVSREVEAEAYIRTIAVDSDSSTDGELHVTIGFSAKESPAAVVATLKGAWELLSTDRRTLAEGRRFQPFVFKLDEPLQEGQVYRIYLEWQGDDEEVCEACRSKSLYFTAPVQAASSEKAIHSMLIPEKLPSDRFRLVFVYSSDEDGFLRIVMKAGKEQIAVGLARIRAGSRRVARVLVKKRVSSPSDTDVQGVDHIRAAFVSSCEHPSKPKFLFRANIYDNRIEQWLLK